MVYFDFPERTVCREILVNFTRNTSAPGSIKIENVGRRVNSVATKLSSRGMNTSLSTHPAQHLSRIPAEKKKNNNLIKK